MQQHSPSDVVQVVIGMVLGIRFSAVWALFLVGLVCALIRGWQLTLAARVKQTRLVR
jgi:hypothetical protein